MHIANLLGTILTLAAVLEGVTVVPATPVQLANGTVSFVQPPRLVAATTSSNTDVEATYYFTINLPPTADEPLQSVTFFQVEGTEQIRFIQEDSFAFEGTRNHRGPKLALKSVNDPKTPTVTVTFDPPVPPGKTVTIGLRPLHNPSYDGVYLLGVSAFPPGERATGQFLGYGRLQFYRSGSSD